MGPSTPAMLAMHLALTPSLRRAAPLLSTLAVALLAVGAALLLTLLA